MIQLTFPDGTTGLYPPETKSYEIIDRLGKLSSPLAAVKINNEVCPLDLPITIKAKIEPVTIDTREGMNIYRRSLCFMLTVAAKKLFPQKKLIVGHSLGYGYYYTLENQDETLTNQNIKDLESLMKELCKKNLEIHTNYIAYEEAVEKFSETQQDGAKLLLHFMSSPRVKINSCEDYIDLYCSPLVYKTEILSVFELRPYGEGFLLRFPSTSLVSKIPQMEEIPQLFKVYSEYKKWGRTIGVSYVGELNQKVEDRKIQDFIEITETLQNKRIAEIADTIVSRPEVKVVLIAGPSSSGKTTTSKKLSLQLRVLGFQPKVIELDDYFVCRTKTPRDKNGNPDYECLEALDVQLLNQNLIDLFDGKEVSIPSYDFKSGTQNFTGKTLKLSEKTILILEGIHGLNDKLTPLIPREKKFKLYLSALTQLNIDDHNRIPTSDNRLIRRIVRDANFRGKDAAGTIKMWSSVQHGERCHIFPFQNTADVMFNSALDYELGVLKVYAEPLLRAVKPTQKEYSEASRLLAFLNNFLQIPATKVPGQSVVREFIGGSDFKY